MSTTITATPTLDKPHYTSGETITVTIPDASAVSETEGTQRLTLSLAAEDGTVQSFTADVAGTLIKHLGVKISGVELDGVAGTIATDGQSATVTAA